MKKWAMFFYMKSIFIWIFLLFSFQVYSHGHKYSEKEIHTALSVFEKAILLSPELLKKTEKHTLVPFYKLNGQKIYLNDGFWNLTRAWLRIYIQEIEEYCPCDLNLDMMIEEAKDYFPESFLKQKVFRTFNKTSREMSHQGVYLVAKYGHTAAILKFSAEVAETILSLTIGGKGIHVFCNIIDVLIFPLVRVAQKYTTAFSYGRQTKKNPLLFSLRMAWLSYRIRKSQKKVFFHIQQTLAFRESELTQINAQGPRSFFHKKGHRLLWIESLKKKTDILFEQMEKWKTQLQIPSLSSQKKESIKKKIRKTSEKIERVSKLNRKDFFGRRYKRYLLLKSRKSHTTYMQGHHLPDKILGQGILWPLSFQENIMEPVLADSPLSQADFKLVTDEIRDGLIEEFLSRKTSIKGNSDFESRKKAIQFFLFDIEQIFDSKNSSDFRLMKVYSIEMALGSLFVYYLKMAGSILSQTHQMSLWEQMRLQWSFGHFFRLTHEFSDFLASVAITNKTDSIQFYKYESMEKLLAFFDYLYEVQTFLANKEVMEKEDIFKILNKQKDRLRSISLLKEKKTSFHLPFVEPSIQCKKLVEKYQ